MTAHRAAALGAAALFYSASLAAQPRGCDRACLEGFLDFYVAAVQRRRRLRFGTLPDGRSVESGPKGSCSPATRRS